MSLWHPIISNNLSFINHLYYVQLLLSLLHQYRNRQWSYSRQGCQQRHTSILPTLVFGFPTYTSFQPLPHPFLGRKCFLIGCLPHHVLWGWAAFSAPFGWWWWNLLSTVNSKQPYYLRVHLYIRKRCQDWQQGIEIGSLLWRGLLLVLLVFPVVCQHTLSIRLSSEQGRLILLS